MAQGKLIAISGIGGRTKEAYAKVLASRIGALYYAPASEPMLEVNYTHQFPGESRFYAAAMAYARARAVAAPHLRTQLNQGKIIITPKYVQENKAHQGIHLSGEKQPHFLDWLDDLEYEQFDIPRPDLNILLNASPRADQNPELGKVAALHLQLAEEEGYPVVNCDGLKEEAEIVDALYEIVKPEIKK